MTVANLRGTYDLDVASSTAEDLVSGELEVEGDILTFSGTVVQTGSYTLAGNTLILTDSDGGTEVLQATFSNEDNTLTILDEDGDTSVFEKRG